jgi:hypothetical protein
LLDAGNVAPEVAEMIEFIRQSKRGVAFGLKQGVVDEGED